MEKLIELLNEYEPYIASDGEHRDNLWGYAYQGHSAVFPKELAESYIISARYGFIKWLVENDKIEGETIGNYQSRTKLRTLTHTAGLWHDAEGKSELEYIKETFTDGLLMLLSISDTPIEDLISYLK